WYLNFRVVIGIFRNSNYLKPTIFHLETFTDRILTWPIFRGHCFVDNRQRRRVLVISANKSAPGDNWDSESREVILRDFVVLHSRSFVRRRLVPVDLDWRRRKVGITEWVDTSQRGRFNAGECPNAI